MFKFLYFTLSLLFSSLCFSQTSETQKKEELIMKQFDSIQYADIRMNGNNEKLKKLLDQSEKLNFRSGVLRGLILMQSYNTRLGNHDLSEKYGSQAEKMAIEEKNYYSLSLIAINRANTAIGLGLIEEARDIIHKNKVNVYKIQDKANRIKCLGNSYMMLGGVYSYLKKNDSLVYYTKKSLDVMATVPVEKLTELQKGPYYHLYIYQLMNMSIICTGKLNPPNMVLAESYLKKALTFSETHPQYFKLCDIDVYETASYFYLEKKEYEKSVFFAKKVLEIEKTKRRPEERLSAYKDLKNAFKALKNETEELKYLNLYTKLSDSLNAVQKKAVINQSRQKIAESKKEFKQEYNNDRTVVFLIAGGILLLFAGSFWYFTHKKKQKYLSKYNEMIDALKNQSKEQEESLEKKDKESKKITILSETEKKLLKKLEAFENSEKFLKKDTTLTSLSNQLNTNPRYLSEIINSQKYQNFNNYINALRINYITYKLYNEKKYREYKISYLAEECGYASSNVFVIAFKNIHGVTPSFFIKQIDSAVKPEQDI
ncbi:helix-turn-helix domain-containing protein [Chryseobacterium sp.]|uniref:helix-turn-helix domain-containing protein n=1 Tax=Chryseobacterium sp. TaxID=1871047 RepID=UPI00321AB2CD